MGGAAVANVPIVAAALSMSRRWTEDITVLSSSSSVEATWRILNRVCDLATGTNNARYWLAAVERGMEMATMAARRMIIGQRQHVWT